MMRVWSLVLSLLLAPAAASAAVTPLASGNGFGFAVYSLDESALNRFYAHPYRFTKPDPENEFAEGQETAQFLRRLSWGEPAGAPASYVRESHVIAAGSSFFFLPFDLKRNALITGSTRARAVLELEWNAPVRSSVKIRTAGGEATVLRFDGFDERLMLVPLPGRAMALVSLEPGDAPRDVAREVLRWAGGRGIGALARREIASLESWRVPPPVKFHSEDERRLWRQSEVVLRMGQSREPNTKERFGNGLIVASLPEGMWFVSWVRDMAYAVVALIRMGHQEEARAALRAYFNARPVGRMRDEVNGYPYQISVVRYFGNGTEEPFFTMAGSPNVEFDGWGLVLWTLTEYVEKFGDDGFLDEVTHRGDVFSVARELIAKPLIGNFEAHGDGKIVAADTSIWEEHQWDAKHFLFSSAAAHAGLTGFQRLAQRRGHSRTAAAVAHEVSLLNSGLHGAFVTDLTLAGTLERNEKNLVDSASMEAINLGAFTDRALILNTIGSMEALKVPSGGYKRVRGDTPYEAHEFLFSNFAMARNYLRLGEAHKGFPLIRKMVGESAKDNYLIPEMYVSEPDEQFPGGIGAPTGSIPMVGYGAGIFVMYLLERDVGL